MTSPTKGKGDLPKGNVSQYAYLVQWVTRGRRDLKKLVTTFIDGLYVRFPYGILYPIQYKYVCSVLLCCYKKVPDLTGIQEFAPLTSLPSYPLGTSPMWQVGYNLHTTSYKHFDYCFFRVKRLIHITYQYT